MSTREQNTDGQLDALRAAGCERVYVDKASGKLARRPEWDRCREQLRGGDALVVTKLDRMGRSVRHLIEVVGELDRQGVELVVLAQGIDTTSPDGRLLFHVLAAMAEFVGDLISENTHEGLAAARARGRVGGRPSVMTAGKLRVARQMLDAGSTVTEIAAHDRGGAGHVVPSSRCAAGTRGQGSKLTQDDVGMSDDPVDVVVALEPSADADPDERDRLARQLRAELRDLDLDAITTASRRDAPPGAKGAELGEWGVWLVTLSASGGVLTSLISVAKDWLDRHGKGNRIKITIDGDTIELDEASAADQAALLKAFVQRHQGKRRQSRR